MPNWSSDDIARIIISVGQQMGITPRGIVIGLATGLVESNLTVYANAKVPGSLDLPHDAVGSDGMSVGVQQQQVVDSGNGWWWGPVQECQDPTSSTRLFFTRLTSHDYNNTSNSPGSYAQAVQGSAFPDRYDERMADAQAIYDRLVSGGTPPVTTPTQDPRLTALEAVRPDFNEFSNWCDNNESRNGTTIDCQFVHTQEAAEDDDNAALDLSNFCIASSNTDNPVSYHTAVRQASDGGVTVVDMVDTDLACWAVGNSNLRSINYCFAGSDASWSREEWLTQSKAIDVVAYLVVQDAIKYNLDPTAHITFGPKYDGKQPPVVSDHRYCTDVLRDGNTHVDVGDNFPADLYEASIRKYWAAANAGSAPTPTPTPDPTPDPDPSQTFEQWLDTASDHDLLVYIAAQLGPGDPSWTSTDEKKDTLRDFLWSHLATAAAKKKAKA